MPKCTANENIRVDNVYEVVKKKLASFFNSCGIMVGRYPKSFSLIPLFITIGLGFGMFMMKQNNDTEEIFTPVGSRIFGERKRMGELFPDSTSWNFDAFGLVDVPSNAILLFRVGGKDKSTQDTYTAADINVDQETYNLFRSEVLQEIRKVVADIKKITVKVDGKKYGVEDICARTLHGCAVDGEQYLDNRFIQAVRAGNVTYPNYHHPRGPVDLSLNLVGVKVENGFLKAARVLKIRFFWRVDLREIAKEWNTAFQDFMGEKRDEKRPHDLNVAYSTSLSLEEELEKGTTSDVVYFTLTLIFMVVYSILVSTGGDVVSTRALLACGGVLAAGMGIVASLGLLAILGVEVVGFVGLMPFLVLGVGVDDMFLLMTAWGESFAREGDVPHRVGMTFASAGVGITITTLTDFLAFLIGISSSFIAVRQFCIFTAVAILLCYFANVTLFGACLSLHGDRVYGGKHCLTCRPAKSRQEYRDKGSNLCMVCCCGGSIPTREFEDESPCEKLPRFLLPRIILNPTCKVIILLALICFFGFAVYGAIKLEPGMKYVDLVLRSSYYFEFSSWDETYFGSRLAVAFAVDKEINYASKEGDVFRRLISDAQRDTSMNSDFVRCWLHQYSRTDYYPPDPANTTLFMNNLRIFLQQNPIFLNDVHMGKGNASIIASRCYVLTVNEIEIFKQSEMMLRLRDLADAVEFPALVYQPVFVMLEHTLAILPSTMQTVGTAVAVMFVVTMMMLPQIMMVCLVTLNIVFIITCVFGSMYYLEITFSGISMIHILMSVGFSVDFSAHICAAYLMCNARFRHDRARYAIVHASGPIFNGGMSSLLGVAMLMLSESYFFRSFFKVMSMVITSGAICSVFFMPIILSYIGPENPVHLSQYAMLQARASLAACRMSIAGSLHQFETLDLNKVNPESTSEQKEAESPVTSEEVPQVSEQEGDGNPSAMQQPQQNNVNQNQRQVEELTTDDLISAQKYDLDYPEYDFQDQECDPQDQKKTHPLQGNHGDGCKPVVFQPVLQQLSTAKQRSVTPMEGSQTPSIDGGSAPALPTLSKTSAGCELWDRAQVPAVGQSPGGRTADVPQKKRHQSDGRVHPLRDGEKTSRCSSPRPVFKA